jgi:two-component system LytT family response regulator
MMTRSSYRVLIAEDEPASLARLVRLCRLESDFVVVATAANGRETLELARVLTPDLLILDIYMPELNGVQVAEALRGPAAPLLVFITAHDGYAVDAFDLRAIDYLLKPFDDSRFRRMMDWALQHLQARGSKTRPVPAGTAPHHSPYRLTVKSSGAIQFIPIGTISHITADGYCARIHTISRTFHVREPLTKLLARLPRTFLRVHRSTVVNRTAVRAVEALTHGEATVHLASGERFKLTRRRRSALHALLSGRVDE